MPEIAETHADVFEPEAQGDDDGQENPEAGQREPAGPAGRVRWLCVRARGDPCSAGSSTNDHFTRD